MGSIGNPKAWVPYVNNKDCSQGFCSLYCPQWCYIIFPPPPPFEFPDDNSSPSFSPLVIAIIGILASAFLLVSYYSIISKYCGNTNSSRRRENDDPIDEDLVRDDNSNPSVHEQPWHVAAATGLDEALIKSITVCKYRNGDGLIEGTDCSVCLSEFEEDESVRLLPKCSHAFHVQCIDTWLKSHSNCPLCRANIFFISASPPQLPPTMAETETPPNHGSLQDHSQGGSENIGAAQDHREGDDGEDHEIVHNNGMIPKSPVRALSDLGNLQGRDIVIEIRDEGHDQDLRRSVSMDHLCQSSRVSIAQVLQMNQDDDMVEDGESAAAGSSKQYSSAAEFVKCSRHKRKMVHSVTNHVAMKRSISSGRQGRVREAIVPL